jgi:large subunit ribosomal protein L32e
VVYADAICSKKTKYMMPSGHKAFLVKCPQDLELLLMHNKTFAAEWVFPR